MNRMLSYIRGLLSQYRGLRRENYILFFGRLVTGLGSMVYPMLTLIITQKMGYSAREASVFSVVAGALLLPAGLLGGRLADRYSKKYIIVLCDLVSVFLYILSAFLPLRLTTLVLLTLASGMQAIEQPAYDALVADITLTKDRERAFSLQYLGGNIGYVAAPTLAGLLFEKHLWLNFFLSGIAILSSTVLIFFLVKDTSPEKEDSAESVYQREGEKAGILKVLRESRPLLLFIAATALFYGAYMQFTFLMPLDITARQGEAGPVIYGSVTSLNCVICVCFTPLITRLLARTAQPRKMLYGILLLAAGYGVFLIPAAFIPLYYIAIIFFTLGEIATTITVSPYLTDRVSAAHRGRISSVSTVLQSLFQSVCLLLSGWLYDRSGSSLLPWCFTLLMLLTSVLLCLRVIKTDPKRYPLLYKGNKENT